MERLEKIFKALIFPHIALAALLLPASAVLLILAFTGAPAVLQYISYAVSAYTLTVWSVRLPKIITWTKRVKENNEFLLRYSSDIHLRVKISLYFSLAINAVYGIFQLALGIYHTSIWYYSMAAYYMLLTLMRLFLLSHTKKYLPCEQIKTEIIKYRMCGAGLLTISLILSAIMFFIVEQGKAFEHGQITTIAIAAFTFITLTVAIINQIKYRKYNSPVFSASKIISLISALVSMITLEATMLTTFGSADGVTRKAFLMFSSAAVSIFTVAVAVYMILGKYKLTGENNE